MRPIKTKEMKHVLLAAPGDEHRVQALPIKRSNNGVSSCWKMSFKERVIALFTGKIWFECLGKTHPPIKLRV